MNLKHITLLTLIFSCSLVLAQWPTSLEGAIDFPGIHYGRFCEDGSNGAWVAGEDYFGNLYVTRLTPDGGFITGTSWIPIGGLYDGQFSSEMFVSEDSCLIIAFSQYEWVAGSTIPHAWGYLQKIDRSGNKLWPEGGVRVTLDESSNLIGMIHAIPEICTDQQGGAYVSWGDMRYGDGLFPAIFSQHVLSDGTVDWQNGGKCILDYIDSDGVQIFATPDSQFVTGEWFRARHEYFYYTVDSEGDTLSRIEHIPSNQGDLVAIDEDYNFYYLDFRTTPDMRVHKVARNGEMIWGESGVLLVRHDLIGVRSSYFVDNTGGFFFSWKREGASFQWIDPSGTPYFDTEQRISTNRWEFSFALTDSSHVMFVQNQLQGDTMNTYSQRVSQSGVLEWPEPTVIHQVLGQSGYSLGPENMSDGNGGEIVFFQSGFLKTKQVSRDGEIGDITVSLQPWEKPSDPEKLRCTLFPNPFNPSTTIKYELSERSDVSLTVYDITGRVITTLVNQFMEPGSYEVSWNGSDRVGRQVAAGMYFARLEAGEFSSVVKMAYLR